MSAAWVAAGSTLRRALIIDADHPAFAGHFPGQPILPGVALLALVIEAARAAPALGAALGPLLHLPAVKFLAAVRPGAALEIEFRLGPRAVDWQVREDCRTVASGRIARCDVGADDAVSSSSSSSPASAAPSP